MSKFTKDEQTEIVRWAMNLEATIQSEQAELSRLMRSRFHSAPAAPTRKVIDQRVKEIKPNYPEKPKVEVDFKEFLAKEAANSPSFFTNLFGTEPLKKGLTITGISIVVTFVLGSLAISGSGSDAVYYDSGANEAGLCFFCRKPCLLLFFLWFHCILFK